MAQAPRQDGGLWAGVQISKDLPRNFSIGGQYQIRLNRNFGNINWHYFYGNVGYRFNKYLAAGLVYRYGTSTRIDRHAFAVTLTARYKAKDWMVAYRTAYQRKQPYFNRSYEPGLEPQNLWRHRFLVQYSINKRWDIYAFTELFFRFTNQRNYLQRLRNSIGVDWEFYKYNTITVAYIFQPEIFEPRPRWSHILGITYQFDIPRKMKWKKYFSGGKSNKSKDKQERERDTFL
jgi:hypothetical protein